jgi:hypothetical protein
MKSDITIGLVCMGISILWVRVLLHTVPDTPLGATILLAPFGILLLTGAFFLVRGRFKGILAWNKTPK